MIINDNKKIILLHNPKTAGRYIFTSDNQTENKKLYNFINHSSAERIMSNEDYKDYQLFTFVRNPYNRFMSACGFTNNSFENGIKIAKSIIIDNEPIKLGWHICFKQQSLYYIKDIVIPFKYESVDDWKKFSEIFNIPIEDLNIKQDYYVSDEQKYQIDKIYKNIDSDIYNLYSLNIK